MPRSVAANKTFKANDLVLSPGSQSVSLKEIKADERIPLYSSSSLLLGTASTDEKVFAVIASSVAPHLKKENCKNTRPTTVVPFWMLDVTDTEANANMKMTIDITKHTIDSDAPDVKVPLIKNTKSLKVGDKLVLYVPPPAVVSAGGTPKLKKAKSMKSS